MSDDPQKESSEKIGSLSVVLPAYNEEVAIGGVLRKVHEYLKRRVTKFEMVVVDDGSVDSTKRIIKQMKQEGIGEIKLIEHEINMGYGEALRSGFNTAACDWILLMDSDGQFDIRDLEGFVPYMKDYDVVIGYRKKRSDTWWRSLMTWGYMQIVRLIFDLKARDAGCAFKLFKHESWQRVQPIMAIDHKIFSVEWLWRLQKMDYRIKQLPAAHYRRVGGLATGARWDVVLAMLGEMVRLRVRG